jgi:hypothetical protein
MDFLPDICQEVRRKTTIAGILAETPTEHPMNTWLKRYRYNSMLGEIWESLKVIY